MNDSMFMRIRKGLYDLFHPSKKLVQAERPFLFKYFCQRFSLKIFHDEKRFFVLGGIEFEYSNNIRMVESADSTSFSLEAQSFFI